LLLVRHTESEWNAIGVWTGTRDVHLSGKGFKDAGKLGEALKDLDIKIDVAYCSEQIRSRETLEGMLDAAQQLDVETIVSPAINERDYGQYTGKNKWDMKELLGDEKWQQIRRGWDEPIPGGETLKQVYERAIPFYEETIVPQVLAGKNVLLAAHGNSLRALMKYIEGVSDEDITKMEMLLGQIMVYGIDEKGKKISLSATKIDTETSPKA
jgi:2,3-bisphosphoglycerate-dependent phosphoglycerate mutase